MPNIENYPFKPVLPNNARALLMGSFPPKADKRCMEFHYPNFQNDMWRIFGLIFFQNPHHFYTADQKSFDPKAILALMQEKGIASHPTVLRAIREKDNASDAFLTPVETVDLEKVLSQLPHCHFIGATGGKAIEIILDKLPESEKQRLANPKSGKIALPKTNQTLTFHFQDRLITLFRLPSTSRAYPMSLENKAAAYRHFFQSAGIL